MTVRNLRQELIDLSVKLGDSYDPAKKSWVKHVTGIDVDKIAGFRFHGELIRRGPVAVTTQAAIFIVALNDYQDVTSHRLITMDNAGNLHATSYVESGPRWASRLEPQVIQLLNSLNSGTGHFGSTTSTQSTSKPIDISGKPLGVRFEVPSSTVLLIAQLAKEMGKTEDYVVTEAVEYLKDLWYKGLHAVPVDPTTRIDVVEQQMHQIAAEGEKAAEEKAFMSKLELEQSLETDTGLAADNLGWETL